MSGRRRFKGGGRRFIQLYHNVKHSEAYHSLSVYARCALFELLDRHTGINNGMIGLGVRELSDALRCSQGTAVKAFREVDDAGLARPLKPGSWRGKKATEWRLTFYRCEVTGELPILNWKPRAEVTSESTKGHVGKHKPDLRSRGKAEKPKSSITESPLRSRGEAHIDIYQGGTALVTDTSPPPGEPSNHVGSTDDRIVALVKWGRAAKLKRWTKPTILSDEPRSDVVAA